MIENSIITRDLVHTKREAENPQQQHHNQGAVGSIGDEQDEEPNARIKRFFKAENTTSVPNVSDGEKHTGSSIKDKINSSQITTIPDVDRVMDDQDTRQRNVRSLTNDENASTTNTHRPINSKTLLSSQNAVPATTSHNCLLYTSPSPRDS